MNKKFNLITKKETSIIFYELNEMPEKVLFYYVKKFPNSNFSKLLKNSAYFQTIVKEDRHLHPWSVWPSVHRGVSSKKHKINFINQNKSKSSFYPPLWEIISNSKKNVGVHGSLQSYPPLINKNIKFYLPDTFSPDSKAYPKELSYLQEFNLYLIKVSQGIQIFSFYKIIKLLSRIIKNKEIKFSTALKIFLHYINSKLFNKFVRRRSIFQTSITFDSYIKNLEKNNLVFSSYFTNHLAGMMHRYWKDLFPKSFNELSYIPSKFNSDSILLAMKEADYQVGKLMKYSKKHNSNLLLISGMGQDKRIRDQYLGELQFTNFKKFNKTIFPENEDLCDILPAMMPDICITINDLKKIDYVLDKFKLITDGDHKTIFDIPYPPEINTINLSFKLSKKLRKDRKVLISGKIFKLNEIGIDIIERNQGTAYHVPEGCLIWYSPKNDKLKKLARRKYKPDILEIAPAICKILDIKIPEYMIKDSPLIKSI